MKAGGVASGEPRYRTYWRQVSDLPSELPNLAQREGKGSPDAIRPGSPPGSPLGRGIGSLSGKSVAFAVPFVPLSLLFSSPFSEFFLARPCQLKTTPWLRSETLAPGTNGAIKVLAPSDNNS